MREGKILPLVILLLCSLLIFSHSNPRKIKPTNLFFWPGQRNLLIMYAYGLLFGLIFYSFYGGADFLTKQHDYRFDLGFNFEDQIPFLPYFSIVYLSGGLSLLLVPFVLPKDQLFIPFLKLITFQEITKKGLKNIGPSIEIMAAAEQLEAHKNAVTLRLKKINNK